MVIKKYKKKNNNNMKGAQNLCYLIFDFYIYEEWKK